MADVTAYGVTYNLPMSPFRIERKGIRYHFSSFSHMQKFKEQMIIKEEWLTDSMSRRFHFKVECGLLADMQLYEKIETRGFYLIVLDTGQVVDSKSKLTLITRVL